MKMDKITEEIKKLVKTPKMKGFKRTLDRPEWMLLAVELYGNPKLGLVESTVITELNKMCEEGKLETCGWKNLVCYKEVQR